MNKFWHSEFKFKTKYVILVLVLFIVSTSFITSVEAVGNDIFKHTIGIPFNWLTIRSTDAVTSVFLLMFNGNDGVLMHPHLLLVDILACYLVVWFGYYIKDKIATKIAAKKTIY